ncbi:hypothetical protein RRF57_004575 [Xylaria bambusicola]|uniref:Uncharacterized protein n=1 Tax=Xylaria bambusicola TaxID=326684 RepID=A0AAN7UAH1_9PEZI
MGWTRKVAVATGYNWQSSEKPNRRERPRTSLGPRGIRSLGLPALNRTGCNGTTGRRDREDPPLPVK